MALGMTSAALAQTAAPTTGLGQAWPNAIDQSTNPRWHVYVFSLNGVKYIQVNDLNGTVHAAVGTAGGTSIVLPVGVDALSVRTGTPPSSTTTSTQTVYRDSMTTMTATPQNNGTTVFTVTSICQDPYNCGGGGGP
jgi:hypothetical protein